MAHPLPCQPTDLPRFVRLFPLAGVILLPRMQLPLQIFEPRYLSMVRDAMASDQLIAIIQPRDIQPHEGGEPPALYQVGALGRITSYSETGDGRLLIALTGIHRFELLAEPAAALPWRQGEADYSRFADDRSPVPPLAAASRADLESTLRRYLETEGLSADWDAIRNADDESLVHSLAAVCPFSAAERQALLECSDFATRAATLGTLMRFAAAAASGRPQ